MQRHGLATAEDEGWLGAVATLLGIGRRTFYDHLKEDTDLKDAVDEGRDRGRTTLRPLQWQRANAGSDTMLIWLGKQLLGQRDKHEIEQTGEQHFTFQHLVAAREVLRQINEERTIAVSVVAWTATAAPHPTTATRRSHRSILWNRRWSDRMLGTDPLPALRQAAATLLAEAPMPVVRGMLRALLDGSEAPSPARADAPVSAQPLQRPEPKPAAVRTKPAPVSAPKPKRTRPPPVPDPAWDERRVQIRTAMQARNVSYGDLAGKFHVAPATLKHALHRRQPPGPSMKRRLDAWMRSAPAPAVAELGAPFRRPNGASGSHAGHSGAAAVAD